MGRTRDAVISLTHATDLLGDVVRGILTRQQTHVDMIGGLLDREKTHLAMIETLNQRDEVYGKLLSVLMGSTTQVAIVLGHYKMAQELYRTADMAGVVMNQLTDEFRAKVMEEE